MANGSFQIDFSRAFVSHEIPGVLLNLLQIARVVSQPHYRGAQKTHTQKKNHWWEFAIAALEKKNLPLIEAMGRVLPFFLAQNVHVFIV